MTIEELRDRLEAEGIVPIPVAVGSARRRSAVSCSSGWISTSECGTVVGAGSTTTLR